MKKPENQKVYHQVQIVGILMILDLVRSGASSALLRKLHKSVWKNTTWTQRHLYQVYRISKNLTKIKEKVNNEKFLTDLAN